MRKAAPDPLRTEEILREEIGLVFAQVLEHCGVFKDDEQGRAGFARFVQVV